MKPVVLHRLSGALTTAALLWSLWTGWRIWTTPVRYQVITWRADAGGQTSRDDEFALRSFSEVSGLGMIPLLVPVALAASATWAALRGRAVLVVALSLLFALFTFVAGFSIGRGYIAPSGLLVVAMGVSIVDRIWRRRLNRQAV